MHATLAVSLDLDENVTYIHCTSYIRQFMTNFAIDAVRNIATSLSNFFGILTRRGSPCRNLHRNFTIPTVNVAGAFYYTTVFNALQNCFSYYNLEENVSYWYNELLSCSRCHTSVFCSLCLRKQEAQLPQRNSASAAHMEGGWS